VITLGTQDVRESSSCNKVFLQESIIFAMHVKCTKKCTCCEAPVKKTYSEFLLDKLHSGEFSQSLIFSKFKLLPPNEILTITNYCIFNWRHQEVVPYCNYLEFHWLLPEEFKKLPDMKDIYLTPVIVQIESGEFYRVPHKYWNHFRTLCTFYTFDKRYPDRVIDDSFPVKVHTNDFTKSLDYINSYIECDKMPNWIKRIFVNSGVEPGARTIHNLRL
jgi:hypothetical protein